MFLAILLLILGFVILIVGAEYFVDGASSVALNFKVSKMLIALTIVAFGTSAPEFAVSIQSIFQGSGDILLGNVIGSNILNILLILGLSSVIYPLKIKSATIKKEMPMLLLISTILFVVTLDTFFDPNTVNMITRSDGIIITIYFTVFIYYLISIMRNKKEEKEEAKYKLGKSIIITLLGLIAIVFGSNLVVNNSVLVAQKLGVSERLISLTIVAFGTSLPELITSVVACIKKENDIAIGNIVGSNIFNICIVLGLPIAIFGGITPSGFSTIDVAMLLLSAVILYIFAYSKQIISRKEGIIMLLLFVVYYAYVIEGGLV